MRADRTRPRTSLIALTAAAATLAACTAGTGGGAAKGPAAEERQTITLWHGFTSDGEVQAFEDVIAGFTRKHPNITVKAVKGQDDEKIVQSIRGNEPPDVASSFTTDNVGQFCSTGAFQDLGPLLTRDRVNLAQFPKTVLEYTAFKGKRCTLPLLADAYGLYYNKELFAEAGLSAPPKTMSELAAYAKRLTKRDGDTIKVAGFLPNMRYYENTFPHWGPSFGTRWYNPDGTSAIGSDPGQKSLLTAQKKLVDDLGGYPALEKFRQGLGQEFSPDNPFHKGKVAMALDGEWRTAMLATDAPDLAYGTAPFPAADDRPELYGAGFISGTVIGIPRGSKHPKAAWELVKYMTTDPDALVTLSNAIRNVPSTLPALKSPKLKKDANFQTFLDIFANPNSTALPSHLNGQFNQEAFQEFGYRWEAGRVKDMAKGLAGVDSEIDKKLELSGG